MPRHAGQRERYVCTGPTEDTFAAPPVPLTKTSDGGSTDYYKIPAGAADLQDLIELKNMNFSVGNIFKACYRLGEKSGTAMAYDLRKIIFFAERELRRVAKAP